MKRDQLYAVLDEYLIALSNRNAAAVPWAAGAKTSENNVMIDPGDGLWGTIDRLGDYRMRFADTHSGEVGYFGVTHESREESGFTLRLKVNAAGEVEEAESVVVRQSDYGIKFEHPR